MTRFPTPLATFWTSGLKHTPNLPLIQVFSWRDGRIPKVKPLGNPWEYNFGIWIIAGWWLSPTPLKNMTVNWDDYSQYMEKIKNVPNHRPVLHKFTVHLITIYQTTRTNKQQPYLTISNHYIHIITCNSQSQQSPASTTSQVDSQVDPILRPPVCTWDSGHESLRSPRSCRCQELRNSPRQQDDS